MNSSQNIIQRIRQGERSVLEDIAAWYSDDVLRLCTLLLGNRDEAEDLMQETFLEFMRLVKDGKLRRENGSIKGFLMTCARNKCINHLKKHNRLTSLEGNVANLKPDRYPQFSPADYTDERRLEQDFQAALNRLPGTQRTALVLFAVNGDSYKEIARTLGISTENVRKNLYRARQQIRNILRKYREIK